MFLSSLLTDAEDYRMHTGGENGPFRDAQPHIEKYKRLVWKDTVFASVQSWGGKPCGNVNVAIV